LLRGAAVDDIVLERQWNDFSAGAFTYVLTQYLWSAPAPLTVERALARSQETMLRFGGSNQQPVASGIRSASKQGNGIYNVPLAGPIAETGRGEGVITAVNSDGKTATVWLGGLPPRVLEYLDSQSVLTCGQRRLKLRSRDGLIGKVRLVDDKKSTSAKTDGTQSNGAKDSDLPLQSGQAVRESIRILPKNINLVVALDSRLERIERVDATSALSALAFVNSTSDTALPADCLLGKPILPAGETMTASLNVMKLVQAGESVFDPSPDALDQLPGNMGYGLFSVTRSLIPGTLALQEEAIKPAINRLTDKLRSLIALKMLRLSENRATSQLAVRAVLEQIDASGTKVLISRQTFVRTQAEKRQIEGFSPDVPAGTRVRYRLFNDSDTPLFYTLITVDPRERLSAFCPVVEPMTSMSSTLPLEESEIGASTATVTESIAPGSSVAIPSADLDWGVGGQAGPVETYVVCSTAPLENTLSLLSAANSGSQRVSPLPNPLEVIRALLTDISQSDESDSYALDVTQWATLNFTYKAV
ncbi:MAG: hypothetical protein AAFU53_09980, partial [Cyanobacteria bacterium J06632_3]